MKVRKITSLTAFLSFFFTLVTSIILYVVPAGRISYWADWRFIGLTKEEWGAIHINLGFLFIFSLILHIYYNWKSITAYLKNSARKLTVFTRDFNVSLLIVIIFVLGTYFKIPPVYTIIEVADSIKEEAADKYGEPPYGHAELSSLSTFTKKMGINTDKAIVLLKKVGYKSVEKTRSIKDIASMNGVSPQKIYIAMKPAMAKNDNIVEIKKGVVPLSTPPGTGNLTLADFCHKYNLNIKIVIRSLLEMKLTASETMTIKEIAEKNSTSPTDIVDKLRDISEKNFN